jgi:signal transduction histidine kinase
MGGGYALADREGRVIVAGSGHGVGDRLSPNARAQSIPITVEGQMVGLLVLGRNVAGMMTAAGVDFLARVNRSLLLAALGAGTLALILGGALARTLTHPLREITAAARQVARGQLDQQVPVRSRDELGELAVAFNQMSADLARARDQRRQMTADIAHDLRTPLSVVLGHLEALRDGVLPPAPETLSLVHDEALRLNRLVEDLRTLSLAEAGELTLARRRIAPGMLIERAAAALLPRAQQRGIALHTHIETGLAEIDVDADRMAQVLGNLLDNALRHTPTGGCVTLTGGSGPTQGTILLSVRDSGPGITPEDLPRIFDRFYRADKARARSAAQDAHRSGLGLAIARSIVEGHGGRIWAESPPGAGAQFFIQIPSAPGEATLSRLAGLPAS